ncbi:MAG: putative symporter YjmB [Promethearchaeota archaeon]|nr:MAG: putative symporter YjmB [Candidatus Lokiarchaeota archaeon]
MSSDADTSILEKETIPTSAKIAFGASSLASMLLSGIGLGGALTYFYNIIYLLDEYWLNLGFTLFIVWNAVNDPILGFLEDRTKTRWGRRIPYLRFGAPIYTLLFCLIWFPFAAPGSQLSLFLNFLIILYAFDTVYSMIGLITYSLPAEMAISSRARSNLMVYGAIASAMGTLLTFLIPDLLLTGADAPPLELFVIVMVILGIVSGVILFVSSYFIREKKYTQMEEPLTYKESLVETFKNKPFLIFEGSNFSWLIAQYILINGVFYYLDFVLELQGFMSLLPLIIFFLMIFITTPIYSKLIDRYPLKKVFLFILIFTGITFLVHFFIGWVFSSAVIGMFMLGIGFGGYFVTNQLIVAETIDFDEVRTGKRRETSYSGVNALITKPAVSLGPVLFLWIINEFGFSNDIANLNRTFNQTLDFIYISQSASAQLGIMIAFTIIPAIFILIAALLIAFFPLTGEEWIQQKVELEKTHKQKEVEYLKKLEEEGKL